MNHELEGIRKEVLSVYLNVLPRISYGGNEENHGRASVMIAGIRIIGVSAGIRTGRFSNMIEERYRLKEFDK
jgi:hypothetical protein